MNSFSKFKKVIGENGEKIAKSAGYTRQGLYNAFGLLDQGKKPSNQFFVCMDSVINKKIEEETLKFTKRIEELKKLQENLQE